MIRWLAGVLSFSLGLTIACSSLAVAGEPAEDALRATVRVRGGAASGTGFLVTDSDGSAGRKLLVTAAHVFDDIHGEKCTVVFRARGEDQTLVRQEVELPIRAGKKPLWLRHPEMDVAAVPFDPPEGADVKPFEYRQIADAALAEERQVRVGQDVCIPCFPVQLEANPAGWPILRRGSIATHPLTPLAGAKTIFVDYSQFGGDSGAPVVAAIDGEAIVVGLVVGMQRQTDKISTPFEERTVHTPLGLGIAVQSPLVRQTIDQWRKKK